MASREYPAEPSGSPAPSAARLRDGRDLDLERVARRACGVYVTQFPDYLDRYGPSGHAWCIHDCQHILHWAILSIDGAIELERELAWLARVLEARDFPPERLARGVEILAASFREEYPDVSDVAQILDRGTRFLRSQASFLV